MYNALAYLRTQSVINPAVTVLVALGAGFVLLDAAKRHERGWFWQALALPMGAGLLLLTCYWGEMAHPYYALAFAGLCAPGLIPLAWLANRAERRGLFAWTLPMAGVLAVTPDVHGALPRRAADAGSESGHAADGLCGNDESGGKPDPCWISPVWIRGFIWRRALCRTADILPTTICRQRRKKRRLRRIWPRAKRSLSSRVTPIRANAMR